MRELARQVLEGEEAWVVGGAVRDELLGRPLVDLDIACAEPERAAREYARRSGGAPFPLSERHGAWRVALEEGRTVDFTPLAHGIERDLATRDFTINAIAEPLAGGEPFDPAGGREDLEFRTIRAVSDSIFEDDPLRLLRAVRLEDELGFHLAPLTLELVRRDAALVVKPAGERILAELTPALARRLPATRRARPARAARRPDRRAARPARLARVPPRRGLRRRAADAADRERDEALPRSAASRVRARRALRARRAPVSARHRAVGARRARIRRRRRAGPTRRGGPCDRAGRAARARRRARASAGACDRRDPGRDRRGARCGYAAHQRGGT